MKKRRKFSVEVKKNHCVLAMMCLRCFLFVAFHEWIGRRLSDDDFAVNESVRMVRCQWKKEEKNNKRPHVEKRWAEKMSMQLAVI